MSEVAGVLWLLVLVGFFRPSEDNIVTCSEISVVQLYLSCIFPRF